jgi:hypothetical protein
VKVLEIRVQDKSKVKNTAPCIDKELGRLARHIQNYPALLPSNVDGLKGAAESPW